MQILNLSHEPEAKLRSWLPPGLKAQKVVFLPDACPSRSPLPTGTAVLFDQPDWRRFAVSDCGCGMRLIRSSLPVEALTRECWNAVADRLRRNKGGLGDLGGGNHFLVALEPYGSGELHFLVHTGSRLESGLVDSLIKRPQEFDREFARIVSWASENRAGVQEALKAEFGPLSLVLDLPHNTFEQLEDGRVIVRKGAVRLRPGETAIIPSHMGGDAALVKATGAIDETLFSMSHGTGRTVPRGEVKSLAGSFDFPSLRAKVLMPEGIEDTSLRTEIPSAYRDLDTCLPMISQYVEVMERFAVIAYMGHLKGPGFSPAREEKKDMDERVKKLLKRAMHSAIEIDDAARKVDLTRADSGVAEAHGMILEATRQLRRAVNIIAPVQEEVEPDAAPGR